MYTSFFGLNEKPFSITPDPRYLFMSERHGEALAHLVYGVTESGGFVQLTGEVGTGKTTLVRTLLLNRIPDNADVAVILNPQLTAHEFLATICEELGIKVPDDKNSMKALTDALNQHLLDAHANGRRTILVVDEAQNLAPAVLEQVRLLTNLETAKQKLLQIILIGQPELRELLARNDLRQLAQRITGRYHLEPLTREETAQYVEHRLRVAGALGEVIDSGAKKAVFRLSQGIPRLINVICDRALLGAYTQESRRVNRRLIRQAASEVSGELNQAPAWQRFAIAAGILGAALAATFVLSVIEKEPDTVDAQAVIALIPLPEEPVVDEPTLSEQLSLASGLTNTDVAMATLFELWNLEYTSTGRDGCLQAAAAGFSCLHQRGSWNGLRQLNRPAILSVIDASGEAHEIVLITASDDSAELSIGGIGVTHPVSAVTRLWFGEYLLLWRPVGGTPISLGAGSRGVAVVWLRESLAEIDDRYRSTMADSEEYDSDLDNIVRLFQRDHRLEVDGLAGPQTQIIINSLLGADGTPRLSSPRIARD